MSDTQPNPLLATVSLTLMIENGEPDFPDPIQNFGRSIICLFFLALIMTLGMDELHLN
jgi:hypothetical protein